jgi:hypothetical protein
MPWIQARAGFRAIADAVEVVTNSIIEARADNHTAADHEAAADLAEQGVAPIL